MVRVIVCVSPRAVVGFAESTVPVLAYDELGGDFLARTFVAVDAPVVQVQVPVGVFDGRCIIPPSGSFCI